MDRHERYETDEDDWFAEPAPVSSREEDWPGAPSATERPPPTGYESAEAEDWLVVDELGPARRGRVRPGSGDRRFLVAAAAAVLVALLIGLAAAGVFSSGGSPKSPTTTGKTTTQRSAPSTTPAASAVPAPPTTLSPGDNGPEVKTLQRALASLGYSPGTVDGDYGPATKTAVTDFQKASGLTADGILGPKTLTALKQALANAG